MVRDLDFSPRKNVARTSTATKSSVSSVPKKKNSNALLWTIIIVLFAAAAIGIWQFMTITQIPATKTPTSTKLNDTDVVSHSTAAEGSILSKQTSQSKIQIYDSGAGPIAVKNLIDKFKALGYEAENLNKSQFNYDKTYIWYREGLLSEAERIQSIISERIVSLKETKIAGSFDILVLLGVQ